LDSDIFLFDCGVLKVLDALKYIQVIIQNNIGVSVSDECREKMSKWLQYFIFQKEHIKNVYNEN